MFKEIKIFFRNIFFFRKTKRKIKKKEKNYKKKLREKLCEKTHVETSWRKSGKI